MNPKQPMYVSYKSRERISPEVMIFIILVYLYIHLLYFCRYSRFCHPHFFVFCYFSLAGPFSGLGQNLAINTKHKC
jgi:hypothetical protein